MENDYHTENTARKRNIVDYEKITREQEATHRAQESRCPKCSGDLSTRNRTFADGTTHLELRCTRGHHIKFLPQNRRICVMPFGRHKGQAIREIPDNYLTWVLENLELKGSLLKALEEEYERRGTEGVLVDDTLVSELGRELAEGEAKR